MHDFLARLVGRALATTEVVRPVSAPRFARAAEPAPAGPSTPTIDGGEVHPARRDTHEPSTRESLPRKREPEPMRVIARVASTADGEVSGTRLPRRNPERIGQIDDAGPAQLGSDDRASAADASPEPLASSPPPASMARVAHSSDRQPAIAEAAPGGDASASDASASTVSIATRLDGTRSKSAPPATLEASAAAGTQARIVRADESVEDLRRLLEPMPAHDSRSETAPRQEVAEPVRISIGRIEVRISTQQSRHERQGERAGDRSSAPAPLVSLDDYLGRQAGERTGRRGR